MKQKDVVAFTGIIRRRNHRVHQGRRRRGCAPTSLRIEPLEARRLLAVVYWDGGAESGDWHDPFNWSGDQLPDANDDVVIDWEDLTISHHSGALRKCYDGR